MNFNKHLDIEGQHAFLSPSKHYWVNYDENKLIDAYKSWRAAQRGTELHDFAKRCIQLGIKLPKNSKTLNMYVNDAIGYGMTPEQPLKYSDNCFGTADTISFKKGLLRIHDYKSGVVPASMNQLKIYMALFCLEYNTDPSKIDNELRIYQNDSVTVEQADPEDINSIIDKIILFDKQIEKLKSEE